MIKFGSLFAGIGGIDLGLERAGMTCAWQVENDEFCTKVLNKHWSDVPKYGDIKEIKSLPYVDLIIGGFPCQAFSTASHGVKIAENLWPEMLRILKLVKPEYVIAENVLDKPIMEAEKNVQAMGYRTGIRRIGAHEIGADHKRDRWWLFAHAHDKSKLYGVFYAKVALLPEIRENIWGWESFSSRRRMVDGISSRMDRLKGLGNAVVPQVAEWIGRKIIEFDN